MLLLFLSASASLFLFCFALLFSFVFLLLCFCSEPWPGPRLLLCFCFCCCFLLPDCFLLPALACGKWRQAWRFCGASLALPASWSCCQKLSASCFLAWPWRSWTLAAPSLLRFLIASCFLLLLLLLPCASVLLLLFLASVAACASVLASCFGCSKSALLRFLLWPAPLLLRNKKRPAWRPSGASWRAFLCAVL